MAFASLVVASSHPWAFIAVGVLWALFAALFIGAFVCSILGAVRASQGRWWRYPLAFRFVRGAAPKDDRV
jgi:uncharacterized Tic20 family protein